MLATGLHTSEPGEQKLETVTNGLGMQADQAWLYLEQRVLPGDQAPRRAENVFGQSQDANTDK